MIIPYPIESGRLRLQPLSEVDLERFQELMNQNRDLTCSLITLDRNYLNLKPSLWLKLLKINSLKHWGIFSIFSKLNEQFLGSCGLVIKKKRAQVFYLLLSKYFGNGYAIESIRLLLDLAFTNLKLDSVEARVPHTKKKTWKPVERSGLRYMGDFKHNNMNFLLFVIDKREFLNQRFY